MDRNLRKQVIKYLAGHYSSDLENLNFDMEQYTDDDFVDGLLRMEFNASEMDEIVTWSRDDFDDIWFDIYKIREVKRAIEYRKEKLETLAWNKYDADMDIPMIDVPFLYKGNLKDYLKSRRY